MNTRARCSEGQYIIETFCVLYTTELESFFETRIQNHHNRFSSTEFNIQVGELDIFKNCIMTEFSLLMNTIIVT